MIIEIKFLKNSPIELFMYWGSFPFFFFKILPADLGIKPTWDRLIGGKAQVLLNVHDGPVMKLRPKKWPRQAVFIHFRQNDSTVVWNCQDKEGRCLGTSVSKEF